MRNPSIRLRKSLSENMTDILMHYNSQAIYQLERKSNLNERIHQVRLCCKRNRSILRLARPALDPHTYIFLNASYRDLSARLSQIRDLTALIETLSVVSGSVHNNNTIKFIARYKQTLQTQRASVLKSDEFQNVIKEVKNGFQKTGLMISETVFTGEQSVVFGKSIRQTYKKGAQLWRLNMQNADDHNMHQWRKQVKYLWYQLVVLEPIWPDIITAIAKQVQTLSKVLGSYHDLVVLHDALTLLIVQGNHKTEIGSLQRIINHKKLSLGKQSMVLGGKLFYLPANRLDGFIENLFT
jgi:CHAD domain-containing protein